MKTLFAMKSLFALLSFVLFMGTALSVPFTAGSLTSGTLSDLVTSGVQSDAVTAGALSIRVADPSILVTDLDNPDVEEPLKKGQPRIRKGFSQQQLQQVRDGINDAMALAHAGMDSINKDMFDRYFAMDANDLVHSILQDMSGPWSGRYFPEGEGNTLLERITIAPDDGQKKACGEFSVATFTMNGDGSATIILCPRAFRHGGINRDYVDVAPAASCRNVGDTVSWAMYTMGATLLKKYLYYKPLFKNPKAFPYGATEAISGPEMCRGQYDGWSEKTCSYIWFTSHAYFTTLCGMEYKYAGVLQNHDPTCPDRYIPECSY
ncbi:uncharacterized protein K452DRAFT_308675 [Aplosporella prunicola CBS 121167]|uniref:Peptidase M43 pregnancy-associated plasma-A domain-containing protein n=1 Tax=Aplosporella prunicola CBS 121167 TaxID=1176127 RepID=A0A6A6BE87_9PEZI|nr:uncharacterized protein K452DRAFT_308675 [Aplosporella prunicola CBS 121167]KAF2141574.1 hypothetical protein K452DRAFT_308675 [Aplosporella prunicola CBS 121167]